MKPRISRYNQDLYNVVRNEQLDGKSLMQIARKHNLTYGMLRNFLSAMNRLPPQFRRCVGKTVSFSAALDIARISDRRIQKILLDNKESSRDDILQLYELEESDQRPFDAIVDEYPSDVAYKKIKLFLSIKNYEQEMTNRSSLLKLPTKFNGRVHSDRHRTKQNQNRLNELSGKDWMQFTRSWSFYRAERNRPESLLFPAKFSERMVSEMIQFFTHPGGIVLDPFLGIGSTLVACQETDRLGIGIEIEERWARLAKIRANRQFVIRGDSTRLSEMNIPTIDFTITSPPYFSQLTKADSRMRQKQRIQLGLSTNYGNSPGNLSNVQKYTAFMRALKSVFDQIFAITRPGGYMAIIANNYFGDGKVTPFAFDLAISLAKTWRLKDEKIWIHQDKKLLPLSLGSSWTSNRHHEYCLVFQKPPPT